MERKNEHTQTRFIGLCGGRILYQLENACSTSDRRQTSLVRIFTHENCLSVRLTNIHTSYTLQTTQRIYGTFQSMKRISIFCYLFILFSARTVHFKCIECRI